MDPEVDGSKKDIGKKLPSPPPEVSLAHQGDVLRPNDSEFCERSCSTMHGRMMSKLLLYNT